MSHADDTAFRFGIEHLAAGFEPAPVERLRGKRVALLAHPASVDEELRHSVEVLVPWTRSNDVHLSALFGPQHGLRGEKQDNMVESQDFTDPTTGLPVFSLYGETRRLTERMIDHFDVLMVDLQDVGVRVYTFLTALGYILEDLHGRSDKEVWVLDRPNPTGRAQEGLSLDKGWESYVGVAPIPMQHGMTMGEFARWYREIRELSTKLTVVPMTGWSGRDARSAWPEGRVWLQPSPNMPALSTARAYPGTVMLEGTTLSEGRGTTRPLSQFGHPDVDWSRVLRRASTFSSGHGRTVSTSGLCGEGGGSDAIVDLFGCRVRQVTFQPTFHKHAGIPTPGVEIIAEGRFYEPARFRPYRLVAALLKAIRLEHPGLKLWTDPPYEYEYEKTPIDVITGGTRFREWVETREATWREMERMLQADEAAWRQESASWWMYGT